MTATTYTARLARLSNLIALCRSTADGYKLDGHADSARLHLNGLRRLLRLRRRYVRRFYPLTLRPVPPQAPAFSATYKMPAVPSGWPRPAFVGGLPIGDAFNED